MIDTKTKAVLVFFVVLIVAFVPLYYYAHPESVEAGTIQIRGNVAYPMNLTLTQLKTLPHVTLQATLQSSGSPQENGIYNYTGVTLQELLNYAQAAGNATSVYVQASDAYGVTLIMRDAAKNSTLLAYEKDGLPMSDLKKGGEGPVRLVLGADKFAQRWVKGVVLIDVT